MTLRLEALSDSPGIETYWKQCMDVVKTMTTQSCDAEASKTFGILPEHTSSNKKVIISFCETLLQLNQLHIKNTMESLTDEIKKLSSHPATSEICSHWRTCTDVLTQTTLKILNRSPRGNQLLAKIFNKHLSSKDFISFDNLPSVQVAKAAILNLKNKKSASSGCIPAKLFKKVGTISNSAFHQYGLRRNVN